jgi:hypothetical protein
MTDIKETVTRTNDVGVDEEGTPAQRQTQHIQTAVKADSKTTVQNIVWYILGLIEILLAFRFLLKLFGANPESGFVDFIYSVSGILSGPFDSIFGASSSSAGDIQSVFEPSILVAAAVYMVIAWGVAKLITINRRDQQS